MSDVTLSDKVLSSSADSHVIAAPIKKTDIADWLFNLPEAEYQRCCRPIISVPGRPQPMTARQCRSMSK
jgi:hypothetical protein